MTEARPLVRFVAPHGPGRCDSGGRQRIANTLRAVCSGADVDVVLLSSPSNTDDTLRRMSGVRSVVNAAASVTPLSVTDRIKAFAAAARPYTYAATTYAIPAVSHPAPSSPQLVWYASLWAWLALPPDGVTPSMVDLYDLEDVPLRRKLSMEGDSHTTWADRLRGALKRARQQRLVRQLRQAQREALAKSDVVFVASAHDRKLLGPQAVVLPNTVALPSVPGRPSVAARPSNGTPQALFVGYLDWWPNEDAVRWFVDEILPRVRALVPAMELQIVGRGADRVRGLGPREGVTLTGFLPELEPAYARADVVVVPLRAGSGTRIKILEAFAHRVPVVATSIGAEGLEVTAGRHLLIEDDAERFASAIARLASDPQLADALTSHAYRLVATSYTHDRVEREVGLAVTNVLQRRPGAGTANA